MLNLWSASCRQNFLCSCYLFFVFYVRFVFCFVLRGKWDGEAWRMAQIVQSIYSQQILLLQVLFSRTDKLDLIWSVVTHHPPACIPAPPTQLYPPANQYHRLTYQIFNHNSTKKNRRNSVRLSINLSWAMQIETGRYARVGLVVY